MHTVSFFPIGNADTCLIELGNGRRVLFDFADMGNHDDQYDLRCNLEAQLRTRLGDDDAIDVVAFTHLDTDHCNRAKDVFYLEHAEKYQSEDRIKIGTMWVPAAAILEVGVEGQARTLRAEARHRFLKGEGIRVFSQPHGLDQFLRDNNINPANRAHLITDAGKLCPGFDLNGDGVEFFVHSPFAEHCDGQLIVRNSSALFMQATFEVDGVQTKLMLSADVDYMTIEDITRVTKYHDNEARLEWHINNIPHHCSYTSLAAEKGKDQTVPSADMKWLYEEQGRDYSILVSTSCPIPNEETVQPPHKQAAAYYRSVANQHGGEFIVSMEHPNRHKPKPLVIEIGSGGATVVKAAGGAATVLGSATPRAGRNGQ